MAQTHDSLARYLLEEAHEVIEALDAGDTDLLREELGDLLMQVLIHSVVAQTSGEGWDIDDVAADITAKLVRRSPHVFADAEAPTAEDVDAAWQQIKAAEKRRRSALDGIAPTLPALATAAKVLERQPDLDTSGDDIGAQLLRLVQEASRQGVDSEAALRRTIQARVTG